MNTSYSSLLNDLQKVWITASSNELYKIKSTFLGKKGILASQFNEMRNISHEEKKKLGQELNKIKTQIELAIREKEKLLNAQKLESKEIDVELPGMNARVGTRHPISITINEITKILSQFGFSKVIGDEIETEFYNFEALNIPETHPARDMHDTFYINVKNLLRTHTSSVQIHSMEKYNAPIKIMTPGRVYRCDSDPTHSPMFHQIEGLYVDEGVSFTHLKGILEEFINLYFGKKMEIRFRPSYFPFTEPSAEIDIKFNNKWLEVLGCGMVHNNVLMNVNIDTKKYSGFAFGLGIERFAMLKYGIRDLRLFYENDLMFLKQFSGIK
ncbi:MAG: phenylalanine--tRNA ligase alpha subunit [Gammaproteobacteria bacterium]|nr:MAG: phenylalanine--tRNA ligase alpha subunit [Gammaproteobacteria bacterium]